MGALPCFSAMFYKESKLYDILFASVKNIVVQKGYILKGKTLLLREEEGTHIFESGIYVLPWV